MLLLLGINAPARTYTTTFSTTENPISEGGNWINGRTHGLDWADVRTVNGMAVGTQSGTRGTDDSTALLTGTWGPNQTVSATVHNANPSSAYFQEVELRLRSTISAHRNTGYEVLFGLRNDSSAYVSIVRWNGAFNDWTTLDAYGGTQYILREGDIVKGVISNQTITAYINDVKVMEVTDGTFSSGSPGLGFYLANATGVNDDYGLTSFLATDAENPTANDPPLAHDQAVITQKDTGVGIVLTGTHPENKPLTFSVPGPPAYGTLGGSPPNITYWPAAGYTGPDSFKFHAFDGITWSAPATVFITVEAPNPPPPHSTNSLPALHAANLTLSVRNVGRNRARLLGVVNVKSQDGLNVPRAAVTATWSLPNGVQLTRTAMTSSSGNAQFNIRSPLGIVGLTIVDVRKRNYTFDPARSAPSQSVSTDN
jgi:hypothetical protein